jgi:hypothetical protein
VDVIRDVSVAISGESGASHGAGERDSDEGELFQANPFALKMTFPDSGRMALMVAPGRPDIEQRLRDLGFLRNAE